MEFGERLRMMRTSRGLSLRELAVKSGLSWGYLGQLESGRSEPSMRALRTLAEVLGVPVGTFFDEPELTQQYAALLQSMRGFEGLVGQPLSTRLIDGPPAGATPESGGQAELSPSGARIVRGRKRSTLAWPSLAGRVYLLTPDLLRLIAVTLNEYDPGRDISRTAHSHEGESFGFVLAGDMDVLHGETWHSLEPGDAIYFSNEVHHWARVRGAVRGQMLWVTAPPSLKAVKTTLPSPADR